MVLTNNRAVDAWSPRVCDELMASAAMDQLPQRAHVTPTGGNSYRVRSMGPGRKGATGRGQDRRRGVADPATAGAVQRPRRHSPGVRRSWLHGSRVWRLGEAWTRGGAGHRA